MVYDRFAFHSYKYVLGVIDVYSRYVVCRPLTNMRMETIMSKLKEIFEELEFYPETINCDNQFNVKEFTDFLSKKGTSLWFSQVEQPHKNALIERLWRNLAMLLQRMREGIKNFDWPKALPYVVDNYNSTLSQNSKSHSHPSLGSKEREYHSKKSIRKYAEERRQSKN